MRTSKILFCTLLLGGMVIFGMTSFTTTSSMGEKLKITNKTDSDIDEIHIGDSGDILDEDEIMEPGESVTIDFDCAHFSADVEATIHLVFEDGSTFSFDDTVCDGDFAWDIVNDGKP